MTALHDDFVAAVDALVAPDADVAQSVMAQLRARSESSERAPRQRTSRPSTARQSTPRAVAVAAVAMIIVAGVVLVVAPARQAVARWLGIGATEVVFVPIEDATAIRPPTSTEDLDDTTLDPVPFLGPPAGTLDGGVARSRSYFWLPDAGQPEIGDSGFGVIVTARLVGGEVASKRLSGEAGVEFVQIMTSEGVIPALWIGGTHEFVADSAASPVLAERVLVWEVDGVQYRLESSMELGQVLVLAADVREGTDLLRPL